jgi:cyclic pyranopterin phosphate synthase
VLLKNATNGAWYNTKCKECRHYPCHDALMALRFSTDNTLQFCLNGERRIDLNRLINSEIETKFAESMRFFQEATFEEFTEKESIR